MSPTPDQKKQHPLSALGFLWRHLWAYPLDILKALLAVVITSATILYVGHGLRQLVDMGFSKAHHDLLDMSALLLIGLALLMAISAYVRTSTTAWLSEKIVNNLRQQLFHHLLHLPIEIFENLRLGDLLSRLNSDCDQIRIFISGYAAVALRTVLQLLGGTIMLILSSPKLTLHVFIILPLILIPISLFGKKVKALTKETQDRDGRSLSFAEERINALTTMKAFSAETHSAETFAHLLGDKLTVVQHRTHYRSLLISLVIGLVFSGIAGILWMGGQEVINGTLSPGQLSAFIFYAILVAGSLNSIADIISTTTQTLGATGRLTELLDTATEAVDQPPIATTIRQGRADFHTLTFEEICFTYPSRPDVPILENVSFSLQKGEKIALVGPSGVGKSTLFKLLMGFYHPQGGRILIDGHPLDQLGLEAVRSLFALVPQDPVIFNASILENIAVAKPDAPREEILKAAAQAYIPEFADKFPHGYETELGEKGVKLSGGQKQRIALARAILKDAPIFLLDEATNALDSQSEAHIQKALQDVLKSKSALMIAHRLSTVKEADQIIVLEDCRLASIGDHTHLMKSSPLYRTLAQQQFLDMSNGSAHAT